MANTKGADRPLLQGAVCSFCVHSRRELTDEDRWSRGFRAAEEE
ncbi:hypothetical protein [Paenibacillus sophorae]|nr:hypothetical protein [Paenibacillus sophorae]